jgi:hypothetical protein
MTMRKSLVLLTVALLAAPSVFAVPNLQLYISGATYEVDDQTWVIGSSSFDLWVIGNAEMSNVMVSMALAQDASPAGVSINVNGTPYSSFIDGFAPFWTAPGFDPGDDLARHGIFPTWYTEFNTADFGPTAWGTSAGRVADVQPPSTWNPTMGYLPGTANGEFRSYSISVTGASFVHFDAYTLNGDGSIQYFAPFSHDAEMVPEPATALLLSLGLMGAGVYRRFKK